MAKSTRSKVKRHFRAKKRQEGVYAATEAARLNRLHQKLKVLTTKDADGDVDIPEEEVDTFSDEQVEGGEQLPGLPNGAGNTGEDGDAMELDPSASAISSKRISTHGPRGSRREQWRSSKGLAPRPVSKGMNRQGGIAARRKAGRSQRRR
ncbi:hypothetical protein AcV7_008240 [Taiwanofungus camphoratus]|nr:hypothetical protein AcV7_008240 [Antrodia cinnamomea]